MKMSLGVQIGAVEMAIAGAKTGGLNKIVARPSEREHILAGAAAALESLRWMQANECDIKAGMALARDAQILEARSKGVA